MKTFNKKGDAGETSLLYGVRVPKSDPRCEAYGTLDEAVSALGLARALSQKEQVRSVVLVLQMDLFVLSAELASPAEHYASFAQKHTVISESETGRLEKLIDEIENEIEMPQAFIIPGVSAASAAIDLARTIVRRAERRVVTVKEQNLLQNPEIPKYLNRLADLLFSLARYEAFGLTEETVKWK